MKIGNRIHLWEDITLHMFMCVHAQVDFFITDRCRSPFVGTFDEEPSLPVEVDRIILTMLGYVIENEDR